MKVLLEAIRRRLGDVAYSNEAHISHGIVTPLLGELGWDTADPVQLVPEYSVRRTRVDFALLGLGRRPAVFIEVKGLGLAAEADRQLFEYAFHEGVPLCVLTDGREWNFYLPGAQGSYDDRRVYRLQLDQRHPSESEQVLNRYLARARVISGRAFEDAQRDYRDNAGRREAAAALPRAWLDCVQEPEPTLATLVGDKAEALCGFRPTEADVSTFLANLAGAVTQRVPVQATPQAGGVSPGSMASLQAPTPPAPVQEPRGTITAKIFGKEVAFDTASEALVEVLRQVTARDPSRIQALSDATRGRARKNIARTASEIHPDRPDLVRGVQFAPGWLVGLNLSNRGKMTIINALRQIYALQAADLEIELPNA